MSRYDRGREHPGIDRLRAQTGAAGEVVLRHRLWDGIGPALDHQPLAG